MKVPPFTYTAPQVTLLLLLVKVPPFIVKVPPSFTFTAPHFMLKFWKVTPSFIMSVPPFSIATAPLVFEVESTPSKVVPFSSVTFEPSPIFITEPSTS